MQRKLLVVFSALLFMIGLFGMANADPIDLSTWTQWGPSGNGVWEVSSDHTTVLQRVNGDPTYFVSDDDYINTQFDGEFSVQTVNIRLTFLLII